MTTTDSIGALFAPLFKRLDAMLAKSPVILAIEGGSASGKSTLATHLEQAYDCTVFHMDDFFLRPEQRTPARFAEPGGNVDRERFLAEVLTPLSRGETVQYRRFDCGTMTILPPVSVTPKRLTVVEGAYATHPAFGAPYGLTVFLDIDPALQKKRILARNPDMAGMFFDRWIPMEHAYFEAMNVRSRCDLTIAVKETGETP